MILDKSDIREAQNSKTVAFASYVTNTHV